MTPDNLHPLLPPLRRFARLVTGEQAAGDALVADVLRGPIDGLVLPESDAKARVALFRLLMDEIRRHRSHDAAAARAEDGIEGRPGALCPQARDAVLLVHVEDFAVAEAAAILDLTPATVAACLEEAGRAWARQSPASVLIIEDEPLIALTLEMILLEMGHRIAGIAATRDEAREIMRRAPPGLVLTDEQLAEGPSGLAAVQASPATAAVPVILLTAFPERMLTGTRTEPAFLITKPFRPEHVKAVVGQALFIGHAGRAPAQPSAASCVSPPSG